MIGTGRRQDPTKALLLQQLLAGGSLMHAFDIHVYLNFKQMKDGNINLIDLDFEYKLWKTRLELFVREVDILRTRNEEVRNQPAIPVLNVVELMVLDDHESQIEKFLNRIVTQENELQYYNKDFPITKAHSYFKDHLTLRRKMDDLTKLHFEKVSDVVKELGI